MSKEFKMENELYHYGILGMKWGVRKSQSKSSSSKRKNGQRKLSDDAREASVIKKKSIGQMTNAELRKANERTRLEQEYSRLNPSTVKKGFAFVVATAGVMNTALNLYNNSDKLIKLGKKFVSK